MGAVAEGSPTKVDAIKDALVALLATIKTPAPGMRNIHKERPPHTRIDEFLKAFEEHAPGGGKMVNAWMLESPTATMDATVQAGRMVKNWTFPIVGYMSISDRKHTKGINVSSIMDELLEQAEIVLMQDETGFTLNGTVINVRQVRTDQAAPLFFSEVLTYVGNIQVDVLTRTQF